MMMLKSVFHLLNVVHYVVIIYFCLNVDIPSHRHKAFGGQWKFLTFWDLWLQLAYFALALLNDLFGSEATTKGKSSKWQKARDFWFASIAFPIGTFVSLAFWLIFAYNRDLIFPLKLEQYYPPLSNHMMHTTPIIGLALELFITFHVFPDRLVGASTLFSLILGYLGWVCVIAYFGGFWVYGILKVMPPLVRAVFILFCSVAASGLYLLGELANALVWSSMKGSKSKAVAANDKTPVQHRYATRSRTKAMKIN